MLKAFLKELVWRIFDLWESHSGEKTLVTFNIRPKLAPWGGGNQWLLTFTKFLKQNGYAVNYRLNAKTQIVFVINTKGMAQGTRTDRVHNGITFGLDEIQSLKASRPSLKVIQRINDSDAHRKSGKIDLMFKKVNSVVDHTVFISNWVLEHHAQKWFDKSKSHSVIHLDANREIFYPQHERIWNPTHHLRIVTHHWSNNPAKGFDWYQRLDSLISSGTIRNVEFWIVGNLPPNLEWKSAKTFAPTHGNTLSEILRKCDAYITASRFEAGGMHLIEGLQCGLPVIFHKEGGGICEVASPYGFEFEDEITLIAAFEKLKQNYSSLRSKLLSSLTSEIRMNTKYLEVMQSLIRN